MAALVVVVNHPEAEVTACLDQLQVVPGWDIPLERGSGAPTKSWDLARNIYGNSRMDNLYTLSHLLFPV